MTYREHEIERVVRLAFDFAATRRKRVASVDKSNVLQSSRLWREITDEVSAGYHDVELEHVLSMPWRCIHQEPERFDVIVTENMFGDILTDEASVLPGSIGLLPRPVSAIDRAAAIGPDSVSTSRFTAVLRISPARARQILAERSCRRR